MKKLLGTLVRIVVSVGILVYLFHNIFHNEAQTVADRIVAAADTPVPQLAKELAVSPRQVELIRAKCAVAERETADLTRLAWAERQQFDWQVGPKHLWSVFEKVKLWWFALGVMCIGIVCGFGIYRWHLILRVEGLQLSLPRTCSIFFVGMFFNAFLLGSTGGDVIKAWYVAHETHHKKAEAVASVIVDRIVGLLALFVIALVMMSFYYHRVFEDKKLIWFSVATLAVVLGTVLVTFLGLWKGLADKLPGVRARLRKLPKYDMISRMVEAYRNYASHPVLLLQTTLLSFGVHIFVMLSIICMGRGLNIVTTNGLIDYFLYLPIINSVAAVPITISGFGVREGMYAVMFGEVGVATSLAVALSLLGYLATLFWSLVGAGFYLTHRKEVVAIEHEAETEQ